VIAAGGDVVLVDGREAAARVAQATGKAPIRLALDGVAGEATFSLTGALASGGTLVVYAGVSGKPSGVNPLHLIFKNLTLKGFWLDHPDIRGSAALGEAMRDAARLVVEGKLAAPVAAVYPAANAKAAIAHAVRGGKVLLDFTPA